MQFISSKVHGVLDYLSGVLLILSPWIFGFATGGFAQWVPILVGATILVVSLLTDYEFSIAKKIPLSSHLAIDILGGALLAISPWLLSFADQVYWPHLIFGIAEIGAGLFTRKVADYQLHNPPRDEYGQTSGHVDSPKIGNVIVTKDRPVNDRQQRQMSNKEERELHLRRKEEQRKDYDRPQP